MASERMQRRIDSFLDEADASASDGNWAAVAEKARAVLAIDEANEDALSFLKMADANSASGATPSQSKIQNPESKIAAPLPSSFAAGRYAVRRFLGEGGRKRVYLAHDSRLDREVAFCVIRAEGLDRAGHQRVLREAQSVARLGQHPNLVTVHDIGEDSGNPYIVQEYMAGGDVAGLVEKAEDHRLAVERTLAVAKDVCRGLSFIHAGGMVHRDLKPANVFLASDGTAKVGDFGLAVALDRSRLTLHGMMLGTVSYMPPEQALGGESTLKADLYSLGAMLYEMVTGRPPFLGDDPTAVISQHINTPPVAPSWVTEHCPPSLEEVILKLLEKDPAQRPANAAEVLAALEKVDPNQKSASHSDSNVLDRLARGVFVGREKELERLRKAFDEAFAGHGGLVMLVGEPGIGKTRTTQELETYAKMRGAQVLWGASHEASGAPAFYPFIQVGRHWGTANANDLSILAPMMAAGGGDLVRLFPELRQLLPGFVEPPAMGDAASAQFRLFEAYSAFVRAISERQPAVVTLDDLHWADKPTLQLLQHLARGLARMRVLVVCSYRDTDITRQSALSETLAALNREPGFERIVLRGLSKEEVRNYIAGAAHVEPTPRVLERIFEETEGNPFFLTEVVNLLTQEGTLSKDSVSDIAVPDGVKEALGRRLDRLSPEANELLQVCAVAGREFAYDTLTLLGDREEGALLRLVEEGLEARVIEEMPQPGRYRFTHALMQETLLAELSTTRRVRLHGQVGEALEKLWGDRAVEFASRLANHFSESATLTEEHAEKALQYLVVAGEQAEARYAWEDATRKYEKAATLLDECRPEAIAESSSVLIALGRCAVAAAEHQLAWRALNRALEQSEKVGDFKNYARAALIPDTRWAPADRVMAVCRTALAHAESIDPPILGSILAKSLVEASLMPGLASPSELANWREELSALQRAHPDVEQRAALQEAEGYRLLQSGEFRASAEALESAAARMATSAARLPPMKAAIWAWSFVGNMEAAIAAAEEAYSTSRTGGQPAGPHAVVLASRYAIAEQLDRAKALSKEHRDPKQHMPSALAIYLATRELDPAAAVSHLPDPGSYAGYEKFDQLAWVHAVRANALWRAGRTDEAAEDWRRGEEADARSLQNDYLMLVVTVSFLDEAGPILASPAYASAVKERWLHEGGWGDAIMLGIGAVLTARVFALWALALGDIEDADRRYRRALLWCQEHGAALEEGRCWQGLADVADRRGDLDRALDCIDHAVQIFTRLRTPYFLDCAIAAKVRLQGLTSEDMKSSIVMVNQAMQAEHPDLRPAASPQGIVTLLFSDIENSTPLNEQMGDARWLELLRAHNALIEREVHAAGGSVVKTMGDGYMVAFSSARAGLHCAIAAQRALGASEKLSGIRVRMGLHTGEMLREGDDFFGRHVNLAARVASSGKGGEVVVSDVVHELVSGGDFVFSDGGEVAMKGFAQPMRVWHLQWDAPASTVSKPAAQLRIDIDRERQARQVAEVIESEYFQSLRSQTADLRSIVEKN